MTTTLNRDPQWVFNRLIQILQARDANAFKAFFESIVMDAMAEQRAGLENVLVEAAASGILTERERCVQIVEEYCPDPMLKSQLIAMFREQEQAPTSHNQTL